MPRLRQFVGWRRFALITAVIVVVVCWYWHGSHRRSAAFQLIDDLGGQLGLKQRPELVTALAGFVGIDEESLPATVVAINLSQTFVRDSDLALLDAFSATSDVDLSETGITDMGLIHIARLSRLQTLDLSETRVSDEGLEHLVGCDELTWLDLTRTDVSDQGLQTLATIPNLRYVNLFHTRTEVETVAVFRAKYPSIQWRR